MCVPSSSASVRPHRCSRRRRFIRERGSARWGRSDGPFMRLRLYRAASMAGAMAQVRAELGSDALILATRRVADGVEVTAALEPEDDTPPLPPPDPTRLAVLDFHA